MMRYFFLIIFLISSLSLWSQVQMEMFLEYNPISGKYYTMLAYENNLHSLEYLEEGIMVIPAKDSIVIKDTIKVTKQKDLLSIDIPPQYQNAWIIGKKKYVECFSGTDDLARYVLVYIETERPNGKPDMIRLIDKEEELYEVEKLIYFRPLPYWLEMGDWKYEGKLDTLDRANMPVYEDGKGNQYVHFLEGYYTEVREIICCFSHIGHTILDIEKALQKKGYHVVLDEYLDEREKAALLNFQKKHNLKEGVLDINTLRALELPY